MNMRDKEPLRKSIAKDLFQSQDEHSPTRELLRQCVPLNGIIHMPEDNRYPQDWSSMPVENHSCAAAPQERKETADQDLSLVRAAYEKATGNRWNKSDSEAYHQNGVGNVPVVKTISALEAVVGRTPTIINSFNISSQRYWRRSRPPAPGRKIALRKMSALSPVFHVCRFWLIDGA